MPGCSWRLCEPPAGERADDHSRCADAFRARSDLLGGGWVVSQVQRLAGQAMRFSVNPQYDMKGLPGTSRFKVLVTIQLLVPDKG